MQEITWDLIRKVFDQNGSILTIEPTCSIISNDKEFLESIANFAAIPFEMTTFKNFTQVLADIYVPQVDNDTSYKLVYRDAHFLDFIGKLYENVDHVHWNHNYVKWFNNDGNTKKLNTFQFYKVDKSAVVPTKFRISDAGFDLTVIKEYKTLNEKTKLYDTGLKIRVPFGYYAEIYPRSSLSKSGYMLANSVGVIDNTYTGNLYIALTKVNEKSPDLEFPFRCCQLIFKKQVHMHLIESKSDFIETTSCARASGGFGSTN